MAVVTIPSLGAEITVPSLIIRKGRGNSVGLWLNRKIRYTYVKIPTNGKLVIQYKDASCGVAYIGNCATVVGEISKASVGNSIKCQGMIERLNTGNCYKIGNFTVGTPDEEYNHEITKRIKEVKELESRGYFSHESIELEIQRIKQEQMLREKNKVVIQISGAMSELKLTEPCGVPTELTIVGTVGVAHVGNCLNMLGDIKRAIARNCIYATKIGEVEHGRLG